MQCRENGEALRCSSRLQLRRIHFPPRGYVWFKEMKEEVARWN